MSGQDDFHKRLDRLMREKIEAILKNNPHYFSDRLAVDDLLKHLRFIPAHQREKIECTARSEGNRIAVDKLIDIMKRYFKFAYPFLESLEESQHVDIAQELLKGVQIDRLPPGENTSYLRKLARRSSSVGSAPSYDSGDVLNDLELEQSAKLCSFQRSRSPPPPYHTYLSTIPGSSSSRNDSLPRNVINSTTTTDNNPSAGPSLSNTDDDDRSMLGAAAREFSDLIPSGTIRERTSLVRANDNLDSKPDDNTVISDVHNSEIRTSATNSFGTVIPNSLTAFGRFREVSPGRYSDLEGTRYDAIVPSVSNAHPSLSSENLVLHQPGRLNERQTIPKDVATQQHRYLSSVAIQGHDYTSQSNFLQKPSTALLDDGATMSTQGALEELPPKDVGFGKKPTNTGNTEELGYPGSIPKKSTDNSAQGNSDDMKVPNDEPPLTQLKCSSSDVLVACLAAISITLFVLKRLKLLNID